MADYASIIGGNPADTLQGDSVGRNQDAYYHIEAADVFIDRFGSSGDSIIDAIGNPNAVRVELGSGTDTVFGGSGSDSVWTGAGDDIAWGGEGNDTVSGASGNDSIESGAGRDSLLGGSGDDTMHAGNGNDYLSGGSGADSLRGDNGDDTVLGGSGDDSLYGQAGSDYMLGGSGADLLMGGAGDDTMFGGTGADVFAFDSGFGQDVISDFGPGDQINLARNLNNTGIAAPADLVTMGMVSGGTTATGTKFTVITIGTDTIRLEKVDHTDFINQIATHVHVG
jgi:Ca2+-binding RTX toxin-like protein